MRYNSLICFKTSINGKCIRKDILTKDILTLNTNPSVSVLKKLNY